MPYFANKYSPLRLIPKIFKLYFSRKPILLTVSPINRDCGVNNTSATPIFFEISSSASSNHTV